MKLDRFGVDAIRQHLAFVTISAQAQLLLLITGHPFHSSVANHTESLFSALSIPQLSTALKSYQVMLMSLRHTLRVGLHFFVVLFVNIVALQT